MIAEDSFDVGFYGDDNGLRRTMGESTPTHSSTIITSTLRDKMPRSAIHCCLISAFLLPCSARAFGDSSIVEPNLVFAESNGLVAVEAEHFFEQTSDHVRAFHLTHSERTPRVSPDGDPPHVAGASGGAYLEALPDTRRTHDDKLVRGQNFAPEPGKLAVLHYKVHFKTAGRYYVWVRAHSTGTEDNGLHVGMDGAWPESGQRLQWCRGKRTWWWESKQRTQKEHCGEPHKIYLDVAEAGDHVIHFSMREDGFEFDKWLMTQRRDFPRPKGVGPKPVIHRGSEPPSFRFVAASPSAQDNTNDKVSRDAEPAPPVSSPTTPLSNDPLQQPRGKNGTGNVAVHGERRVWHKITLDVAGPYAHEKDNKPNPFTDYRMEVKFTHQSGTSYTIPGYFAADGNAGETSAESGNVWRVHFAPDKHVELRSFLSQG